MKTIIRYYDWPNESIACKTLLRGETDEILKSGFSIAVVFQHSNDDPETFFDEARGTVDAQRALALAEANGQPFGSAIYFGVDGVDQVINSVVWEYSKSNGQKMTEARKQELRDRGMDEHSLRKHVRFYERFLEYHKRIFNRPPQALSGKDMLPFIEKYFVTIGDIFRKAAAKNEGGVGYDVGAYGSGLVCAFLIDKYAKYCWLAQSTGWPEYKRFRDSGRWSMLQKLPTVCREWTNVRKPNERVDFDFNQVNPKQANFGQWSKKRQNTADVPRPAGCPALP